MKVAFIIPNLYPPSGNTVTVVRYIEEAAKYCDRIILFQSYPFRDENDHYFKLLSSMNNVKVITLRFGWYKLVEFTRFLPCGYFFHYLYFPLFVFVRRRHNESLFRSTLKGFNGIYAFDFVDSDIFPKDAPPVIVGTHNQKMGPLKVDAINHGIILKRAAGIRLFNSESKFLKSFQRKQARVIPKGVNTDLFYPRNGNKNEKLRFLYVSRLEPRKGLDILLEAWKLSSVVQRAELHIVGSGSLSSVVQSSDQKGIIYHGALFDQDLAKVYRQCDVFIFPTEWDAQPSVLVEALSSGLFTLCSDRLTGIHDDFKNEGFLEYVKNDSKSFSIAIKETVSQWSEDFEKRQRMHNKVAEHLSQANEVQMILQFISNLNQQKDGDHVDQLHHT